MTHRTIVALAFVAAGAAIAQTQPQAPQQTPEQQQLDQRIRQAVANNTNARQLAGQLSDMQAALNEAILQRDEALKAAKECSAPKDVKPK